MYVLLEGIDNAGKSTQLKLLKDVLKDEMVAIKEPGNTEVGEEFRNILLNKGLASREAEVLLFLADRAENYKVNVEENRKDKIVVSDRGFISGICYARDESGDGYFGDKYDFDFLFNINKFAMKDSLPEKVVLFSFKREILEERIKGKELDNIESKGLDYLMKVQKDMLEIVNKTGVEFIIVDAGMPREDIHKEILNFVLK